jgi:hypothetical protein
VIVAIGAPITTVGLVLRRDCAVSAESGELVSAFAAFAE